MELILKRDLNLIRSLMLEIEANELGDLMEIANFKCEGVPPHLLHFRVYQFQLMSDCKWIELERNHGNELACRRLTWIGHDILGQIRDENSWQSESIQNVLHYCDFEVVLKAMNHLESQRIPQEFSWEQLRPLD